MEQRLKQSMLKHVHKEKKIPYEINFAIITFLSKM